MHLYSCKLDGSAVRRLTFNVSSDMDPHMMSDGRLVYAGWQRRTLDRGPRGRVALFGVNIDGTDCALFAADQTKRIRRMPCATTNGLVVFVEADEVRWDGAGSLACVQVRRPLHSYRQITAESDGLFHSPSPLPDGRVLVSRRPPNGCCGAGFPACRLAVAGWKACPTPSSKNLSVKCTHGVYRLDPLSGKAEPVFDDPNYHDIQAKSIAPRPVPDGRSSVVTEKAPHGRLYCLNVYNSDLKQRAWMPRGTVKAVRVLEGIPVKAGDAATRRGDENMTRGNERESPCLPLAVSPPRRVSPPPLVQRRLLGQIPVEEDGSFNIEVPANTPIELQLLDADGMAIRSCGWIWAKNNEPRGCIGCHEDGELTPENWFVDALGRSSIPLCLPPERRRTVDFRRDVMPILNKKCASCHRRGEAKPRLDGGFELISHAGKKASFNRAYASLLGEGQTFGQPIRSGRLKSLPHKEPGVGQAFQPAGYVRPGKARISPLVWRIFGRNTSRPWDGAVARETAGWHAQSGAMGVEAVATPFENSGRATPTCKIGGLTDDERQAFLEWIDMGALWDGIPGPDDLPGGKKTK